MMFMLNLKFLFNKKISLYGEYSTSYGELNTSFSSLISSLKFTFFILIECAFKKKSLSTFYIFYSVS